MEAIDSLRMTPRLNPLIADRIIVPRIDKLPVILRIWPCSAETQGKAGGARFVMTLNALGPKPKFSATAEARLACVMARGTPCNIAAQEFPKPGMACHSAEFSRSLATAAFSTSARWSAVGTYSAGISRSVSLN
jgi:hypothetical protein